MKFLETLFSLIVGCFLLWVTGTVLYHLAFGRIDDNLADPFIKGCYCFAMLLWAWIYHSFSKTPIQMFFGFVEIALALWSDWYQLGKLAAASQLLRQIHPFGTVPAQSLAESVAFVVGGLAVLASGIKDISEGVKKGRENDWGEGAD